MSEKLTYQPLPEYMNKAEIEQLVEKGDKQTLMLLPLALGESFPEWKYAQDICLTLVESQDEEIRANACLGLAYIARTKGKLEKHRVKPVLMRELRNQQELRWRILDSIEDINRFMQWNLAHKYTDKTS